jgi:hypothetical protein
MLIRSAFTIDQEEQKKKRKKKRGRNSEAIRARGFVFIHKA